MMRFMHYRKIHGIIRCVSGLRIGGSKETIDIGGMENPVIRNPFDDFPYIPGSSLKGKIRSLLEWEIDGKLDPSGGIHECAVKECPICRIFGVLNAGGAFGPGRAIFRDSWVTNDSRKELEKLRDRKGILYVEEKMETAIDRLKGRAKDRSLRPYERVPAGTDFDFSIDYRVFEMEDGDGKADNGQTDRTNLEWLLHGLWLLEQDALGSCGSRGYGQIEFGVFARLEEDLETEGEGRVFTPGKVYVDGGLRELKDRYAELAEDGSKRKREE